ncbi:hypothetical protein SAMN02745206_02584 [Desulfacinum infernum DSM 9756]|uniref:Uncharacterized protein n=1 Tax=Desulfacinum infernum DSM 9756 TaxID=1121391 RepID=A0A1M5E6X0_9BACT|nr:hypothetical protein SAMN02745206_02584 [Desulfacinum infernum DSM 9756]
MGSILLGFNVLISVYSRSFTVLFHVNPHHGEPVKAKDETHL